MKECEICKKDGNFRKNCERCKANFFVCLNCAEKANCEKCAELQSNEIESENSVQIEKCFRCNKKVSENSEFTKTQFKKCKSKTHFCIECADCWVTAQQKLTTDGGDRFCYLCQVDLRVQGILYENRALDCGHGIAVCSPCQSVFLQAKVICPRCQPPIAGRPRCTVCLCEGESGISVLPLGCAEPEHRFPICLRCSEKLGAQSFPCRYCDNKPRQIALFFAPYAERALIGLSLTANALCADRLSFDPIVCPQCAEFTVLPFALEAAERVECALLPFAAVVAANGRAFVSGGFDAAAERSSDGACALRLRRDGRFRVCGFKALPPMAQRRHAHRLFYDERARRLYAIGGACKRSLGDIEYIASIESAEIGGEAIENWSFCGVKLAIARCFFSLYFYGEKLYVFGGIGVGGRALSSIEAIDFSTRKSEEIRAEIPEKIRFLKPIFVESDRLFLFGDENVFAFDFSRRELSFERKEQNAAIYTFSAFERVFRFRGSALGGVSPNGAFEFDVFRGGKAIVDGKFGFVSGKSIGTLKLENVNLFDYSIVEFEN